MTILMNTVGEYSCTRCGKVKMILGTTENINIKCCDGDKQVKHVQGNVPVTSKPATIVEPTPVVPTGKPLPPAPQVMNPSAQPINIKLSQAAKEAK